MDTFARAIKVLIIRQMIHRRGCTERTYINS